ncbi:MAG: hypothetical protein ACYDBQ_01225 [Thermoplasmatota archaeon]
MKKTPPERHDADVLTYGFEVDPAIDSIGLGKPGQSPKPGKPADYRGISFPSKEAAAAWLRHATDSFLENEQVILAEEQQVPSPYKAYAILTTSRLILLKTHPARVPDVWIYNPKLLSLRAAASGQYSTLSITDPNNTRLEVGLLHPQAAQRIEDVVRLMMVGRLVPQSEVPSRVAFEGVYPIEYYEAMMGPNQARQIHTLDYGRHRLVLEAATGARRGFFLFRHYLETPTGYKEVDEQVAPFRSNRAQVVREHGPPYQIFILPASKETPTEVLAKHGITLRGGAEEIRERYVQQVQRTGLATMVEALNAAGATPGHERGQYALVRGADNDYVHFNGRVFPFDKNGNPVHVKHLHPT